MTSVPLYFASQKKCASGMRVTAGLQNHTRQQRDLKTAAMVSPSSGSATVICTPVGRSPTPAKASGSSMPRDGGKAAQRGERRALEHHLGAQVETDGTRAKLDRIVDEAVRDLGQRLVPGDALPLAVPRAPPPASSGKGCVACRTCTWSGAAPSGSRADRSPARPPECPYSPCCSSRQTMPFLTYTLKAQVPVQFVPWVPWATRSQVHFRRMRSSQAP